MSDLPSLPPEPQANAPKSECAVWLADVGRITGAFKIFPCRPDDGAVDEDGKPLCKRPRFKGWQGSASWDAKATACTWADYPDSNIGLAIQPGAVVLDADIYKPGNEALLQVFEAEYGKLPPTLEFASANGGFHLIYSTGKLFGNGTGNLPKFGDVRGYGGYVVGPGSTAGGKPYAVAELRMPVPLPPHVDARLTERRAATGESRELKPGVILDDPVSVARYTVWLLTEADPGTSGTNGNNKLSAAGAMGSSYGLSEDMTMDLIETHFNPRCDEAWTREQIDKHAGSNYRGATSRFGNMAHVSTKALGFSDVTGRVTAPSSGGDFRTMADIPGPAPAREWAIGDDSDGWVPLGGVTFVYGPGGAGKSTLATQTALDVSRGDKVFGLLPVRKMPAVLVECEDPEHELHRRFENQGRRKDDQVTFISMAGKDAALHRPLRQKDAEDAPFYRKLDHHLATLPAGPKMLLIANLSGIYLGNYYEPVEIVAFQTMLNGLAEKHEATIIVFAHPSENQKTTGTGSYGGVQWPNGLRAQLYFERRMTRPARRGDKPQPIGRERVLSRKKANYSDDSSDGSIVLDWQDGVFMLVNRPKPDLAAGIFEPVEGTSSGGRPAAVAHGIIQTAIETILAGNPSKAFSALGLANDAAHLLGTQRHGVPSESIRRHVLPGMRDSGHPAYQRDGGKGHWRHATVH